jgi:hypothetical protein
VTSPQSATVEKELLQLALKTNICLKISQWKWTVQISTLHNCLSIITNVGRWDKSCSISLRLFSSIRWQAALGLKMGDETIVPKWYTGPPYWTGNQMIQSIVKNNLTMSTQLYKSNTRVCLVHLWEFLVQNNYTIPICSWENGACHTLISTNATIRSIKQITSADGPHSQSIMQPQILRKGFICHASNLPGFSALFFIHQPA